MVPYSIEMFRNYDESSEKLLFALRDFWTFPEIS
jgi:hypothetical protein